MEYFAGLDISMSGSISVCWTAKAWWFGSSRWRALIEKTFIIFVLNGQEETRDIPRISIK